MSLCILLASSHTVLTDLLGAHLRATHPDARILVASTLAALQTHATTPLDLIIAAPLFAEGEAITWLEERRPKARIVLLTTGEDDVMLEQIRSLRPEGVAHPLDGLGALDTVIAAVLHGRTLQSPTYRRVAAARRSDPLFYSKRLTSRQIDVLKVLGSNRPVALIAQELGLAEATILDHLRDARLNLGLGRLGELVGYGYEHGFTRPFAPPHQP